jgi:WD40 repeat protein
VAFSPDGTLIATASADGTARTWDAVTGLARATLIGHTRDVNAVGFSPDGTLIVTGSADGTARTWDAANSQPRLILNVPTREPARRAGPFGALLSVAGRARSGRALPHAVNQVAFSPDGTLIVTGSDDGTARTWDAATGEAGVTVKGGYYGATRVVFSPDGTLIATAFADFLNRGAAFTWDTATGQPHRTLTGHTDYVTGVVFSPDGSLIATASADRTARIWDTATGKPRCTLTGHTDDVTGVVFSPDGSLIATASADRTARIWNTAGACLAVLRAFSADGYAVLLADGSYKLETSSRGELWWAVKLARFEPGEIEQFVPIIRRRPADFLITGFAER